MKYNKGEWSEAYTFVKLIGEGKVHASDSNLNKKEDKVYPILKVFKDDIERYYVCIFEEGIVNIVDFDGNVVDTFDSNLFIETANQTLEDIKKGKGRSFEIPQMENFLNKIGITSFKGSSSKKEDIKMEILDLLFNTAKILTFSVKSELGSKATILNASHATNFTFKLEGISKEEVDNLNSINKEVDNKWLKLKFSKIFEGCQNKQYSVFLVDEIDNVFYQNLRLIDSNLHNLLADILFYYYSHENISNINALTEELIKNNPLNFNNSESKLFYKKKICEFIEAVIFGMMPNTKWGGNYEISGGLLTVKQDGEILCHHLFYDNDSLRDYLYENVKLETPSTSRHNYGQIYEKDGEFYFKLNLQLRFN